MVWEQSNQSGGFTTGAPWLPVSHEHLNRAVALQEHDPAALLHHYRRALSFRRTHRALVKGDQLNVRAEGDVLSFVRKTDREEIFCAFNLSESPNVIDMPPGEWLQIGVELGSAAPAGDGRLHLGPWQPSLALRKPK